MAEFTGFPQVTLAQPDGQRSQVPCFGTDGQRALVPDRSRRPSAFRMWPMCALHGLVYQPGSRCPMCGEVQQ